MTEAVNMENQTIDTQSNPDADIIVSIKNIILLQESKVTEETPPDGENSTEDENSTEGENSTEDENENELNLVHRSETFYKDAQVYWKAVPATIDGMLGGFSNINVTDIRGSQDFLKDVFKMKPSPNKNVALDCGAGKRFSIRTDLVILFVNRKHYVQFQESGALQSIY